MNVKKININQTEPSYYIASDIYDVTANNNGATFASLTELLSDENLSTLIPTEIRCGGMTIRFIQSSDNKYVQYRLLSTSFSTTESDWQGVDDVPTIGSDNIVKSGGVFDSIGNRITEEFLIGKNIISKNLFNKNDEYLNIGNFLNSDNAWESNNALGESGYIPVLENKIYKWTYFGKYVEIYWDKWPVCFYDCDKNFISGISNPSTLRYIVTPINACYMRFSFPLSKIDQLVISFNENVSSYIPYISPVQDNQLLNHSVGLYLPHNQVDFWDIVDYKEGILTNSGYLDYNFPSYGTLTYDISKYVGKTIVIYISYTVSNYSLWPVFIIIKDDESVVVYNDSSLPKKMYCPIITSYKVQEGDKLLKLSVGKAKTNGYAALMVGTDLNSSGQTGVIIPPFLKQSAYDVKLEMLQYLNYINNQMFDENSEDIVENKYIMKVENGEVVWDDYNGVNESGYIKVKPKTNVYKTDFDTVGNIISTNWGHLVVCLFTENKTPTKVISNPSTLGYIVIPENVYYIRFCYVNSHKIVISEGANVTQYYEYIHENYTIKNRIEDVNTNLQNQINAVEVDIDSINQRIADITGDGSQWIGKTWYAYGTSITSIAQGKYVSYLAAMSQMNVVNKGIPSGGIGDLGGYSRGQVKDAIMNTTDGKLNADLITLEVGANDTGANVSLGTIYDTDETTLCGCLNMCIRYLQQNTNAQIVVMPSPATTTIPDSENKYYEAMWLFKQVCFINKCWWIDGMTNLGTSKILRTDIKYIEDNIHQTELGGYVFAKAIWAELKRIPTFDITLPN